MFTLNRFSISSTSSLSLSLSSDLDHSSFPTQSLTLPASATHSTRFSNAAHTSIFDFELESEDPTGLSPSKAEMAWPLEEPEETTSAYSSHDRRDSDAFSYNHRASSSTPNSWYAALATEPPREEDFILDSELDASSLHHHPKPAARLPPVLVTDQPPSPADVAKAGELPVYNADGQEIPFKNLFLESQDGSARQLIIFVRHFFCRACRTYIRHLKDSLPADPRDRDADHANAPTVNGSPIPTNIIVISPMKPSMIKRYIAATDVNYPVYADPSCKVFSALGCKAWGWFGSRPQYLRNEHALMTAGKTLLDNYTQLLIGRGRGRGPMFQVGGEFLFEDGQISWCHRMRNMRDHSEVDVIKEVLDIDIDDSLNYKDSMGDDSLDGQSCELVPEDYEGAWAEYDGANYSSKTSGEHTDATSYNEEHLSHYSSVKDMHRHHHVYVDEPVHEPPYKVGGPVHIVDEPVHVVGESVYRADGPIHMVDEPVHIVDEPVHNDVDDFGRIYGERVGDDYYHSEPSPSPVVRSGSVKRQPNKLKKKQSRVWPTRGTSSSESAQSWNKRF